MISLWCKLEVLFLATFPNGKSHSEWISTIIIQISADVLKWKLRWKLFQNKVAFVKSRLLPPLIFPESDVNFDNRCRDQWAIKQEEPVLNCYTIVLNYSPNEKVKGNGAKVQTTPNPRWRKLEVRAYNYLPAVNWLFCDIRLFPKWRYIL